MSGVLDRMVQRSRGELPAVEPLVSPRRTAAALRPGLAEAIEEREAQPGAPEPPRQTASPEKRRQPAFEMDATVPQAPAGRPEAAEVEESRRPAKKAAPANRSHEAPDRPPMLTRDREKVEIEAARDTADPAHAAPRAKTKPERTTAEAQTASLPGGEVVAPTLAEAREPGPAAQQMRGATPIKRNEIELEAKPASMATAPLAALPAPAAPHAAAPGIPAEAKQIEAGEHTEIHITIGSIELRAPRTETQAPPFRPRVTLDEFLRRRPGAES